MLEEETGALRVESLVQQEHSQEVAVAGLELVLSGTRAQLFPLHYADSFGKLCKLVDHIEIPR